MKQKKILKMLSDVIDELRENRQWGTAHIYQSTHNSFSLYIKGIDIPFADLTPALLKDYETYLRQRQCSWNTVATYMKVLKAVYNRAVDQGQAPFVPRLFRHVRTSPSAERKKALEASDMKKILYDAGDMADNSCQRKGRRATNPTRGAKVGRTSLPTSLQRARMFFSLMFLLRGIPFVDLVYLRKTDIKENILSYRRRKTGRLLTVTLTPEASRLIRQLSNTDKKSPYLFPFLSSQEGTEDAYHEYQLALRRFNRQLKILSEHESSLSHLSTYAARHTWATLAYYCEIHPGIISEAMGHSSIAVTEVYLKPFRNSRIDKANSQVISFVKEQ